MTRGKYIVFEGPEGAGKTTQLHELVRRLHEANLPVRNLREPDSQSDLTARAIRHLTQDPHYPMNTKTEVLLYNAARSQSLSVIKESLNAGVNCIVDRNYLTTLAIQYYGRGDVPDYSAINSIISFAVGDMEPDLTIVLDAPVNVLRERLKKRLTGERFDKLDDAFLERVRAGYLWEAKQRGYPVVFATAPEEEVTKEIWNLVAKTLARRDKALPQKSSEPTAIKEIISSQSQKLDKNQIDEVYLTKDEDQITITEKGWDFLRSSVTNPESNVYGFNDRLSPVTIAAAMARLSRRGDDMRVTILDEFAGKAEKDSELLKRIITAYGDDSVQQLGGIHIVVENASNLLTKKLEWGRLASYLEQSTRYIYFDQKDKDGKYKYFVPKNLKPAIKRQFIADIDLIFDNYSKMVRQLTDYVRKNSDTPEKERDIAWKGATRAQACDAARHVLPVATKSTVGIYASGQAIESLIMHLTSDELLEASETGAKILEEARKVIPMYLERADKPERGGAMIAYRANTYASVRKFTADNIKAVHSSNFEEPINLIDYWPKNEMLLVADMLYEHSNLSLEEIQNEVNTWTYDKKAEAFKTYFGERLNRRQKPGRALEKAHYSWDIICDYGIFRDLQRHRMVDDLQWQFLTPRYGYEIPKLIEDAGLSDIFEECFDISLKLHSVLNDAGYALEAQYATLLGNKMRWKITYNAREAFHLHELRTTPQGHPGYRKLVRQMHEKLAEVHPLIAEGMIFVNSDEDPKLTRLAAERYTQYKLSKLKK
ncbi:MAG TPA: dTMP kinase [Candidatus Sulfotelmatobacter sp.]|nr:dTMP kinase [Candidatus Sulfotelmatobacter sp.]